MRAIFGKLAGGPGPDKEAEPQASRYRVPRNKRRGVSCERDS